MLDFPAFVSTGTNESVQEIKTYLYRQAEALNAHFSNLTVDAIWKQTAQALTASDTAKTAEKPSLAAGYEDVKALVIKSAEVAVKESEKIYKELSGRYLALSDYGKYFQHTTFTIEGSSYGVTEMFTYTSQLDSEDSSVRVETKNYIKQGLLDDSSLVPIYGVDIGLLSKKVTADGTVLEEETAPIKTRITPDAWELWRYGNKVAYTSENSIYFPNARITGGSIDINGRFSVDANGYMYASGGSFSGTITSGTINSSAVIIGDSSGGFTTANGSDGVAVSTGALMYGSLGIPRFSYAGDIEGDGKPYIIVTENGCRMQKGAATCYIIDENFVAGNANARITVGNDLKVGRKSGNGEWREFDLISAFVDTEGNVIYSYDLLRRCEDLEFRLSELESK